MRRPNWDNTESATRALKRKIKILNEKNAYLKNMPKEGYFIDNISKNEIKIIDCKSSTLRRYIKLLDNIYESITSEKEKKEVLDKKIEIEFELNGREDGIK